MYAKDRVETTGAVWLGLTIGCATCHDHKFDPIAQKEFYQFAAFFRNTTQNPMDGIPDTPPVVVLPGKEDTERWEELRREVSDAREAVPRHREDSGSVVKNALKDFLSHYDSHPDLAERLVSAGESKRDPSIPAVELAAWIMVASDVMNLDEALNK